MISIFQIYYDKNSYKHMDPSFYPYSSQEYNQYFESLAMKKIYEMNPELKNGMEYIGVTSWKMNSKTHLKGSEIIDYINKDIESGISKDAYIYSPIQGFISKGDNNGIISQPTIWEGHKGRLQVHKIDKLLNDAGVLPFDLFDGKWQYCYRNYWIARKEIFDEYCKTVLLPAIKFFERSDIKAQMPNWYQHSSGKKYNSACFTLEGLFGSFLAHNNYTFDYICKPQTGKIRKMVKIDSYQIS